MERGKILRWLIVIMAGGVFLYIALTVVDPDFGWHIRLGEIIRYEGIPTKDPFTYTMKDYPFVDYEWGTNLAWYLIYSSGGKWVLAIIYTLMALLVPWVAIPKGDEKNKLLVAMLLWAVVLSRFAIRSQVITWLFLAVIARWVWDKKLWLKYRWWYPAVMLVWTNLHGSFPIGIVVVGVWMGGEVITNRRIDWKDAAIWLSGVAATMINPYGVRDWTEVLKQMSRSGWFTQTVAEWIPGYVRMDLGSMLIISILIIGVLEFRKSLNLSYGLAVGIIGIMAIGAQRNWPLLAVFAAPLLADIWEKIKKLVKEPEMAGRWRTFNRLILGIAVIILLEESYLVIKTDRNMGLNFYPQKAVEYLKTKKISGRIFNDYAWGGYLDWQMPGERIFVDGRMTGFSWRAPPGQSDDAFKEYVEVIGGKRDALGVFEKYGVRTVLLEKQEAETNAGFDLAGYLKTKGWRVEYEDELAMILVQSGYER